MLRYVNGYDSDVRVYSEDINNNGLSWAEFDFSGNVVCECERSSIAPGLTTEDIEEAKRAIKNMHPAPYKNVYLRFGYLPENGRSRDHSSGEVEAGVSCYSLRWDFIEGCYKRTGGGLDGAAIYYMFAKAPMFLITGHECGVGRDGEPTLENVYILSTLTFDTKKDGYSVGKEIHMAGYNGFSMSNNAVLAYQNGEKPISGWKKGDILDAIQKYAAEQGIDVHIELLKKVSAPLLKERFLWKSSWHHTSSMYNKTDFYALDEDAVESLTLEHIQQMIEQSKTKAVKEEPQVEVWECEYLVWSGSRAHPKATKMTAVGEIKGNWFFLPDGGKKSVNANGFRMIRQITDPEEMPKQQPKVPKL